MPEETAGRITLVCESAFATDARGQLARCVDGDDRTSVLAILYRGDVERWTAALRDRREQLSSAAIVGVGPVAENCGAVDSGGLRVVSDPTDLTGVGIAVTEWLQAQRPGERPVVCLDSLSTVLQYADPERTFRFLHALTSQFRSAGARAFISVDPGAHDESTLATLRTLVDDELRETTDRIGPASEGPSAPARAHRSDGSEGHTVVTDGGNPETARRAASDRE
ncbi:DUF7504 family protein [Halosimplex amylolyticum]|uniref:DUF7504 family protein n=1 Tax=Halosimplex amylolyticum TaxID=3396616 RepID=UPI003F543BC6